ncbi:MAG: bacillithiol system redox-active protein YtxJ [Myxococcota bacterium]|nr:bacillithiol system redox-active protein YtxJ [Myxococcota bacterium]
MADKLKNLADEGALEEAMAADTAILYKHSSFCAISMGVKRQIERFAGRNPDIPLYVVDVVGDRDLSTQLAEDFGIQHQSPQAIALRSGKAQHHASHHEITVDLLEKWIA